MTVKFFSFLYSMTTNDLLSGLKAKVSIIRLRHLNPELKNFNPKTVSKFASVSS